MLHAWSDGNDVKSLTVILLDGLSETRIDGVVALVAQDSTGQFGLRPGHAPFVTALVPGILRLRRADGSERLLACADAVLHCVRSEVRIVGARFLAAGRDEDLPAELDRVVRAERAIGAADREAAARVERELLRRLRQWSAERSG